jgi:hypothetical protein
MWQFEQKESACVPLTVLSYKTARCHNSGSQILNSHRRQNLKTYMVWASSLNKQVHVFHLFRFTKSPLPLMRLRGEVQGEEAHVLNEIQERSSE